MTVKKQSPSILMVISLFSPKGTYDANHLTNYITINLRDQVLRIPGVAQWDSSAAQTIACGFALAG